MIGNDIVDLHHAAKTSNWKHPRYLSKIFTPAEQLIITNSINHHKTIWLLWSMKEAAYKIHVRQFGKRFFNPKRLVCNLNSTNKGIVSVDNETYFTESIITQDYIYTIASKKPIQDINTFVFKTDFLSQKDQSLQLKHKFLRSLSETKGFKMNSLKIKKTEIGIPEVFQGSEKIFNHFSLTHCGRFSSYAYS